MTSDDNHIRAASDPELDDRDHIKFIGEDTWHSVRELRAAAGIHQERHMAPTPLTSDQFRAMSRELPPPCGYREPLAAMRAAAATPLSRFADTQADARMREVMATRAALDADIESPFPHLTTAEASELAAKYAPPNPYAEPLRKMKENNK